MSRHTGQPAWFREMKAEKEARALLMREPTRRFLAIAGVPTATTKAVHDVYPTVWELAKAERPKLRAVPGVGPAALRKIRAALDARHIPVAW